MPAKKLIIVGVFFVLLSAALCPVGLWVSGKLMIKLMAYPDYLVKITTFLDLVHSITPTTPKKIKIYFGISGLVGAALALFPIFLYVVVLIASRYKEEIFGSARFARDLEIKKVGLLPTKKERAALKYPSLLIGKYKKQFLHFSGQEFLYLAAPTRSGKGVGIVIPNLLTYSDSVVCVDVKYENFLYTAGYRKSCGQDVFLFAPDGFAESEEIRRQGNVKSHRYNPLHYVRRDMKYRDGDVQKIVDILFPPERSDIWKGLAGNFAKGLICYLLDSEKNQKEAGAKNVIIPTIPILMKLGNQTGGYSSFIERSLKEHEEEENPLSEGTRAAFNEFLEMHDKGRSSVLMTFNAEMKVYTNPTCAASLSGNDFDFENLRRKRMSIFVGVSPDGIVTYSRLINLLFTQLIMVNTRTLPDQDASLKYQVLLLLDEFPALGVVNILADAIGLTAGYNLRYLIIVQDHAQLCSQKLYGKERADNIRKNCMVRLVYPPKDVDDTAKEVSETLGYKTVKSRETSYAYQPKGGRTRNVSQKKERRALMLPQEIVDLGSELYSKTKISSKEIIIMEKLKPFIANKIIYFDEPAFQARKKFSLDAVPKIPLLFDNQGVVNE